MNPRVIVGALAATAVIAAAIHFAGDPADAARAAVEPAKQAESSAPAPLPAPPTTRGSAARRPVPADPRLAALMVSPDDALIEFVADRDGRVIKEVDNDRASASFGKPLREYTYAGDRVIRLVRFRYSGDETQVVTVDVVYRADGDIADYRESTRYDFAAQGKPAR